MKDIINFSDLKKLKPYQAVGEICIDLIDPVTGKVKKRVDGKNMVFPDSLYSGDRGSWITAISDSFLVLNNNDTPINLNMPYVLGNTIGYGIPSAESLGLYRGAYSAANQVLAVKTLEGVRWKFQYNFTAPQAVGTIKNIGLTHQYMSIQKQTPDRYEPIALLREAYIYTCDGRYSYVCSDAGVITKYDNYLGVSSTINISAIVGTILGEDKVVGYAPDTGKYYVYRYSETPENRNMYEFTDATFLTLTGTYPMTNSNYNPSSSSNRTLYIYGNKAFYPYNFTKIDFINNLDATTQPLPSSHPIIGAVSFSGYYTLAYDKYIIKLGAYHSSGGWVYDMSAEEFVGYLTAVNLGSSSLKEISAIRHPQAANFLPVLAYSNLYNNCAIAAKVLDEPFVKPDNLGMRATYELKVFWDL